MEVSRIIAEIDAQILKLQQARALLAETNLAAAPRNRPGRPKGTTKVKVAAAGKKRRNLSAEGRKRIADAMKKRWAEHRKQAAKG